MNTTLHRSTTTHPPDTEDRTVLHIPDPADLRRLGVVDRVTLRFGLWLLERAQRPRQDKALHIPEDPFVRRERSIPSRESTALLTYHLQRQLR